MDPNLFYLGQFISLTLPVSECDSKQSALLTSLNGGLPSPLKA